jgi:hypothetical protein
MTSRSVRRRLDGSAPWLTALPVVAVLAGCGGPVEAYRQVAGFNRNDPDPATAPFTENLTEAENRGYPNLASVPDAPIVATTAGERGKIAEQLNAQRASTEAPDVKGRPGSPAPGPVPPPPPLPPSLAALAPPPPPAPLPAPPMRGVDEPPATQPLVSTLQSPTVAPATGAEPPRPAPPQGAVSPIPQPAPAQLPPSVQASGNPQPAPAAPVLPAPQPSPQAAALPAPKPPPTPVVMTAFDIAPGAVSLSNADQSRLADVVAQYQRQPGIVRVVAYAAPGVGGAEQLAAFRAALDRAQLVIRFLTAAGIPAKQLQSQAAPTSAAAPVGRIEVQLLAAPPGGGPG